MRFFSNNLQQTYGVILLYYLTQKRITDSTVLGEQIQYAVHKSKQIALPEHLAQQVDTGTLVT